MTSFLRQATVSIAVAITIVLCNHWRHVIHHVRDSQTSDRNNVPHYLPAHPSSWALRRDGHRTNNANNDASGARYNDTSAEPRRDGWFIPWHICGGCYRSRSNGRHCAQMVKSRQKDYNLSLSDAATVVGKENKGCQICDIDYCLASRFEGVEHSEQSARKKYQTKYWRFDRSGPKFTNPTTLALPSIPSELRIPPSRFEDVGAYFQQKYDQAKQNGVAPKSEMDFFMEYNPGLVAIPPTMKQHLPEEAVYLLSLRVTPANNCFPASTYAGLPKYLWNSVYQTVTNNLGLALLDEKYQMIPGYDVVIDLGEQLGLKRPPAVFDSPLFMDYRLFVLNDEVYLHANADTAVVTKISLGAKGFTNIPAGVNTADLTKEERLDQPYTIQNLYGGNNLQLTVMHQFNTIWSGGIYGKNYALFTLPNATHPDAPGPIYAEIDIAPHHVQQILPEEYTQLPKKTVFERIWKVGTHKSRRADIDRLNARAVKEIGNMSESESMPLPSFSTVDELWFPGAEAPFKEAAHGGACCVSFSADELNLGGAKHNHHEMLMVGIAHTKVSWKPWYSRKNVPQMKKDRVPHTHYVSYIYAFDTHPPFQIRVRSGYFCLGHATSASWNELSPSDGGITNPHSNLTRNRMLQQNRITFDCPQVHYISAFIEKAGDPSKTIIGYGLNDCTGRLVEVEKREIVRLLYPYPMDMIFEEK